MSTITILHVSDLHYSKNKSEQCKVLVSGLLSDLDHLKEKYDLCPDLFFFTGDLVQKGADSTELFKWVSGNVVDPILDKLKLTSERFFCVPGNHEVDRTKIYDVIEIGLSEKLCSPEAFEEYYSTLDSSGLGYAATIEKLESYFGFENAYPKDTKVTQNHFYSGYDLEIHGIKIGIGCLNSAWRSSHLGTDKGRLILGRTVVENLARELGETDIKLALCHHPFDWLADWDQKQVKRRISRNFDLLFNGHVHDSDPSFFQESFGGFYTSTAGCLKEGDHFSHYSIIRIDLSDKTITSFLRKWYPDRQEFDQETEKTRDGIVRISNFQCANPEITERLQLHKYRQKISEEAEDVQLVNPWEGIVELTLNDVFVEPVICDTSSLNRANDDPHSLSLQDLLASNENLFFFGRQESGKSMLMQHIESHLLQDRPEFEQSIPVACKFTDLPRNNPLGIVNLICKSVGNEIDSTEAKVLLDKGRVVLLVDDLVDRNSADCTKRVSALAKFIQAFPKTRVIGTLQEQISQQIHPDVITLQTALNAKSVYIWPFTTAKLKQLLTNMSRARSMDVNKMLDQIVFYFHHLQIPVTPLAATLFIGVLFRDPKQKNIQNEAYLIENYLESILEKLDGASATSALDFREKESFLAHIAWAMVQRNTHSLDIYDFEALKLSYFKEFDEELPPSKVFDDFFKKGILMKSSGVVSFKFKFWHYFFIAKSLEKSPDKQQDILSRTDYLTFSTAIGYKAGLVRNDSALLKFLAGKLDQEIAKVEAILGFEGDQTLRIEEQLKIAGSSIGAKLTAKMSTNDFEKVADSRFGLSAADPVEVSSSEDPVDDLGELLTLHADVLRNTREISGEEKLVEVVRSVEGFLSLMWGVIRGVDEMVTELDEKNLERLFFMKMVEGSQKQRLKNMMAASQRMVFQMVPVSFAFYMCDHLCNPKLAPVMLRCSEQAKSDSERLFYYFLLYKCNPIMGHPKLLEYARKGKKGAGDLIATLFLRVYSYETSLNEVEIDKLVDLIDEFRKKNIVYIDNAPPYLKDSFREDVKKAISGKQIKRGRLIRKKRKNKRKK